MKDLLLNFGWINGACVFFFLSGSIYLLIFHFCRSKKIQSASLTLPIQPDPSSLSKECEAYRTYLISYLENLIHYHHLSPEHSEVIRYNINQLEGMIESGCPVVPLMEETNRCLRLAANASPQVRKKNPERNDPVTFRDLMLRVTLNPFERMTGQS